MSCNVAVIRPLAARTSNQYSLQYGSAKLIEAVKQRPILLESSMKNYKDAERKSRAWKEVAAEMGVDGKS
jgi:hypothetical protein